MNRDFHFHRWQGHWLRVPYGNLAAPLQDEVKCSLWKPGCTPPGWGQMRWPFPTWLGYTVYSFPHRSEGATSRGGGIAFIVKNSLRKQISTTASFPFQHNSSEATQLTFTHNPERIHFFCVYRPPPCKINKLQETKFFDPLPNFLEHCNGLTRKLIIMGNFKFPFELHDNTNARKLHEMTEIFSLDRSVAKTTHKQGHLLNRVFNRQNDNLLRSIKLDHGLTSDHITVHCELNTPKPIIRSELVTFQSISKINTAAFKQDFMDSITSHTKKGWRSGWLVSWYFEPSQPQWITSGLKQTSICLLFTLHTRHQTTNSPKTTESVLTKIYIKQNIHKHRTQIFQRISPFGIASVKTKQKAHKTRTCCCGPFHQFINTRFFFKVYIKKRSRQKQ